ncbi:VOC family protein [Thalassotalea mangrovi]|uniref:VOC domain-containing protein n=1 Tax=Thalassotalea mangrovi TaxID=2572245 RepID=A0A4V5NUF0_9GAMM|nr:VOC family protein [Thalassotalea mangrovi]TKB46056.1 hypothetical protein E8M12_05355 [Thalassotalea mangrovi]
MSNPESVTDNLSDVLNHYICGLAHVGYVVPDLKASIREYQLIYGISNDSIEVFPPFDSDDMPLTRFAFININGTTMELIEPLQEPYLKLLTTQPCAGGGLNHLAWYVSDIEAALNALKTRGIYPGYVTPDGVIDLGSRKMVYLNPDDCHQHLIELIELNDENANAGHLPRQGGEDG